MAFDVCPTFAMEVNQPRFGQPSYNYKKAIPYEIRLKGQHIAHTANMIHQHGDSNIFKVQSQQVQDTFYEVDISKHTCTCIFFQMYLYCKHEYAVRIATSKGVAEALPNKGRLPRYHARKGRAMGKMYMPFGKRPAIKKPGRKQAAINIVSHPC